MWYGIGGLFSSLNKKNITYNFIKNAPFIKYKHLFNHFFSRTAWVSQYQKSTTILDFKEARDDGILRWQWHRPDHMQTTYTSHQTDNHTNTSSLQQYKIRKQAFLLFTTTLLLLLLLRAFI